MAFTKFLILTAVIAASVNAKFVWQDDNDFPTFPKPRMPVPPTPPFLPFAPFPPFPPFPAFGAGFGHFPNFPFPQIPLPVVPTPGQIKNVVPGPGQVFHGTVVKSSSSYTTDKDGNPVRTGGTVILTNNNGVVKEIKEGDAPPDINVPIPAPTKLKLDLPKFDHNFPDFEPIEIPDFPEIKPLKFPDFPEIKPLKFPDIVMPTFEPIEPIDPEKIKNYVPKDGETFSAISTSSSSSSRTVNGKTVSDGAASVLVNDNGKTDEQHVAFHKGDEDADGN